MAYECLFFRKILPNNFFTPERFVYRAFARTRIYCFSGIIFDKTRFRLYISGRLLLYFSGVNAFRRLRPIRQAFNIEITQIYLASRVN